MTTEKKKRCQRFLLGVPTCSIRFLAIISLITVLNIMNSISMGVSARIKQYGAMRAVGMESRQVTKMIAAEAITYAASGAIVGIVLGLMLHHLIYVKSLSAILGEHGKSQLRQLL